jgi:phospholipid/cholesterol/gamma-HCH transport system substrate-binding protein
MTTTNQNNIRLGIFVSIGVLVLIFSLYMIGMNKSLFGANFELRSRFSNASGLRKGNNVLYAGIQAGTVKDIVLINDTTIEVTLLIDDKLSGFVNKNALVTIGSDGLMGNKIVQIQPNGPATPVKRGELLKSKSGMNIDQMLQVLSRTSQNVEDISAGLKITVRQINQSAFLDVLKDHKTADRLMMSVVHINNATSDIEVFGRALAKGAKSNTGTIGLLLADTALAGNIRQTANDIRSASGRADRSVQRLEQLAKTIDSAANSSSGLLYLVLKDTVMAKKLNATMDNVQNGTAGFNQNMEALKHSFLFRGYFRKLEQKKQ